MSATPRAGLTLPASCRRGRRAGHAKFSLLLMQLPQWMASNAIVAQ